MRTIDKLTLKYASILKNLDYQRLEGFQLQELLRERITLDQSQKIQGDIYFQGDVTVQGL